MWLQAVHLIVLSQLALVMSEIINPPDYKFTPKTPVLSDKTKEDLGIPEDALLKFPDFSKKYGYYVEEHTLVTKDGYVNTMFRIPHRLNASNAVVGAPVLAMHGFVGSADTWTVPGPGYSLGWQMVDAGYDLWFPNFRGNSYSRKHVNYDPDTDAEYWRFSYDEMAQYDLPACIDYILGETGYDTLSYVGYSQGTTIFFAMGAYQPDYYKKVKVMIALAPIAWLTHARSPLLRFVSAATYELDEVADVFGIQELFQNSSISNQIIEYLCHSAVLSPLPCGSVMFIIAGEDEKELRPELIPVQYGHSPCGASKQNTAHLGQGFNSNKFKRYDHGVLQNMQVYGSKNPPEYDVSLVTTPVAAFIGLNDLLSSVDDVNTLLSHLPNVIERYVVPRPKWNHFDHVLGAEAPELVGLKIIDILGKY